MMFDPGTIISYREMCDAEGTSLQRGMNFRLNPRYSVILMSLRSGAPYDDQIEDDGRLLIYEGHDEPKKVGGVDPKKMDQPRVHTGGSLTQNGHFWEAAHRYKQGEQKPESVRVYEKIKSGIWVYNGLFHLIDAWQQHDGIRSVYKFKLQLTSIIDHVENETLELDHSRMIPSSVKVDVWKRDNGRCRICGSDKNLHFDHIIPFSKGGTSLKSENIQLLCAVHNLAKRDKIE